MTKQNKINHTNCIVEASNFANLIKRIFTNLINNLIGPY